MRAHPGAARKRIARESALKNRLQHPRERVVYHPVAERRRGNLPGLGIENRERAVAPRPVAAFDQLAPQLHQLGFQVHPEGRHVRALPFPGPGCLRRRQQVGEAGQYRPQAAHSLHALAAALLQPPTIRPISSSFSALNP